jgi:hypothetical protein
MKNAIVLTLAGLLLAGCANLPPELQGVLDQAAGSEAALGEGDIAAGLKEALATGTQRAISRIGVTDGFWKNVSLRIPLPENLQKAEKALRMFGQGERVEEFHLSLNRAAEKAVPEAASIFGNAIRAMSLADARQILNGPPTAATDYFRGKTTTTLMERFKPVVSRATASVGATREYKDLAVKVARYMPGFETQDIDAYVTDRALSGLFQTLGEEEKRIRQDPAARTTELLRRVFGSR